MVFMKNKIASKQLRISRYALRIDEMVWWEIYREKMELFCFVRKLVLITTGKCNVILDILRRNLGGGAIFGTHSAK